MGTGPEAYLHLQLAGRYLIEHHLGSGLCAHAYKGFDTLLQGAVVVKIIKTEIEGIPIEIGEEWKQECRKAMQVRGHPHIAGILDLGEETLTIEGVEEQVRFMVTEFVEGRTLREFENTNHPFETSELLEIADQLLSTLDFLQARKLSHDDLHSGNIMVSYVGANKPFIKVIDFGTATNTILPRSKEKDVHFALNQLEVLCRQAQAVPRDTLARSVLESFEALLKKGANLLMAGRMTLADMIAEIEDLRKQLTGNVISLTKATLEELGPRARIEVQRRTPFAGRMDEIHDIYKGVKRTFLSKKGSSFSICGEAGIGKTRLIDEIVGRITADRIRHAFFYARCTQQLQGLPLGAVFEAVTSFLDDIPKDNDLDRLSVLLGQSHALVKPLAKIMGSGRSADHDGTASVTDAEELVGTTHLLAGLLLEIALTTPVVLFLDDIHFVDPATIDFLKFLATKISKSAVIIFVTFEPEETADPDENTPHPVKRLLEDPVWKEMSALIELRGLEREELDEILSNLYTFLQPSDFNNLSDQVRQMAAGNPYYLLEIASLMESEGYLVTKRGGLWSLDGYYPKFALPSSVNVLIERRIKRLSQDETELLKFAAIQGQTFDLSILLKMIPQPTDRLYETLEDLLKSNILMRAREQGRYVFNHAQVYEVILRGVEQEELMEGHLEVARLLEKIALQNAKQIQHHLIAHHLIHAGHPREAAEHYLAAGKSALASQQHQLALDYFSRARALIPMESAPNELFLEITLDLLEAVKPLRDLPTHEWAVRDLKAVADSIADPSLQLRAQLEECIYLRTIGESEHSLTVAKIVLELAARMENTPIEAAALREAGAACYLMGDAQGAEEYLRHSASMFATFGDHAEIARVYNTLGLVYRSIGRDSDTIQILARARDIFHNINDVVGERLPVGNLGNLYLEQGELERAYECFLSIRQSLATHPDLMMEARVESSIGVILLEVGLVDEAREICDHALSIFHNIGNQKGACEVLDTLAKIHLCKGEDQLSREYTERSMDMKRELGDKSGVLSSQLNIARIANRQARYREALEIAKEVLSGARDAHLKSLELECLVEIMQAKSQMSGPEVALAVLSSDESPDQLEDIASPAVIDFASKVGELSLLAGDQRMAARYIILSGKSVQSIIAHFENPKWREAYSDKRAKTLAAYERLRSNVRTT